MSSLFIDIFDPKRLAVWHKLPSFIGQDPWYLAGGTALALQIKHRISYDFDFFGQNKMDRDCRARAIKVFGESSRFTMDTPEQLSFFSPQDVKITLAYTPHRPLHQLRDGDVKIESIADIAYDKAFTLGRRGAARDYVDLAYILKSGENLSDIIQGATQKYGAMFDEKLFLEQLDYMDDVEDFAITYLEDGLTRDQVAKTLHQKVVAYLAVKLS